MALIFNYPFNAYKISPVIDKHYRQKRDWAKQKIYRRISKTENAD